MPKAGRAEGAAADVAIRRAREGDARLLAGWRVIDELRRYQPLTALPESALRRRLRHRERASLGEERGNSLMWIVEAGGSPVGWVVLTIDDWQQRNASIAYSLEPAAWGRGIATQAVTLLLDLAFGPGRLQRIECTMMVDNERSKRLAERLGFTQEGRLRSLVEMPGGRRDFFIYSLLREEWAPDPAVK